MGCGTWQQPGQRTLSACEAQGGPSRWFMVRSSHEQSGFSQQYISNLERGRRNPTIVSLYELAQALGTQGHSVLVMMCRVQAAGRS